MFALRGMAVLTVSLFFFILPMLVGCADDADDSISDVQDDDVADDDASDDDLADDDAADDDQVDDDITDDDTAECHSGAYLTFDLTEDERNVPFPSYVFTEEDTSSPTGRRLNVRGHVTTYLDSFIKDNLILKAMNELDGFGMSAPVLFPVGAAPSKWHFPDADEPGADDAVFCIVLEDENHPHYGEFWPLDVWYLRDVDLIRIEQRMPFLQNTTYACVVSNALRTEDGDCYEKPDHLRYVMQSESDADHPEYELLEPYRQLLAPYFQRLFDQCALTEQDIVGATFFHTQWAAHDLLSIREQLEETALTDPPQVDEWVRLDQTQPNVDSIWEGGYDSINWQHRGVFVHDEAGIPQSTGFTPVMARLTLPEKGVNGYEPPYPVVIYGHGVADDRAQSAKLAQTLAAEGFATVAIDWVWHGDRQGWIQYLPDWLIPTARTFMLINVIQPLKMRDNLRQGVADTIWLKHLIRELDELDLQPYLSGGDGIPDLDTEHIYFAGMSLGSLHGEVLAALEPDIRTYLFNVGAADWVTIGLEGSIGHIIMLVLKAIDWITPLTTESDVRIAMDLWHTIVDGGDPYGYGIHIIREPLVEGATEPTNILQQMAAFDDTLGGPGSAQLSRSVGLTQLRPIVWPIPDVPQADAPFEGPAVFQYDTSHHAFLLSNNEFYDAVHLQAAVFFRTAHDDGTATIINPLE